MYHDRLYNQRQHHTPNMTSHLLEVQDKVTTTLHRFQQHSSIDRDINNLNTFMGDK